MPLCSPAQVETRRARPLLGTLVEIQAGGLPPARLARALERAFAAIARVQTRMSFHDPSSDVSRLNRLAAQHSVKVDAWTWTVLRHARWLSRISDGRFDITIAPRLQQWGLLPGPPARGHGRGNWRDIVLLSGHRVRFRTPLTIDLGGIAKGYAVDRAVAALRQAGVVAGLVNAGGDLRAFGRRARPVHVRHPTQPGTFFQLEPVRNEALATSALTFTGQRWRGKKIGALVDPHTGGACGHGLSISVRAPHAWLADGLTKVVATDPLAGKALLGRCKARAQIFASATAAIAMMPDAA